MIRSLGIIGAGSITSEMLRVLGREKKKLFDEAIILARPGKGQDVSGRLERMIDAIATKYRVVEDIDHLIDARPDLVVEAAGHSAVSDFVPALLRSGIETVIASTGALSDAALHQELKAAALEGGSRLVLASGAIGGMDILAALQRSDVRSVVYTSRKPPMAWKGTPAEEAVDLDGLTSEAIFFEGNARKAASDYPKNANVAATIALAGVGFERTDVKMIADPAVSANTHVFDIVSDAAEVAIRIVGKPSPANPKTSMPTVFSLVREVMNRIDPVIS